MTLPTKWRRIILDQMIIIIYLTFEMNKVDDSLMLYNWVIFDFMAYFVGEKYDRLHSSLKIINHKNQY